VSCREYPCHVGSTLVMSGVPLSGKKIARPLVAERLALAFLGQALFSGQNRVVRFVFGGDLPLVRAWPGCWVLRTRRGNPFAREARFMRRCSGWMAGRSKGTLGFGRSAFFFFRARRCVLCQDVKGAHEGPPPWPLALRRIDRVRPACSDVQICST